MLLLSEKEKVLNFNKERKKSHTEVTKIYSKNKSSVKLQKGGKKHNNVLILLSHLKLQNLHLQCMMRSIKVEKAFNV